MNPEREEYTPVEEEIMPLTQVQEEVIIPLTREEKEQDSETQYNLDEFLVLNTEPANGNTRAAGTLQKLDVGNSAVEVQGKSGHSSLNIVNSTTQNMNPGKKTLPEGPVFKSNQYFCSNCRNCYRTFGTMKIHERACVRGNTEVPLTDRQCKECHKVYISVANLKEHMKMHSGIVPLRCDRCYRKYFDEKEYTAHMDRHKRHDELLATGIKLNAQHPGLHLVVREFNCVFCKKDFMTANIEGQVKRRFTCDACLQKYNRGETPHQGPQRYYSCDRCGRNYVFQAFLLRHQPNCDGSFKRIHRKRKT